MKCVERRWMSVILLVLLLMVGVGPLPIGAQGNRRSPLGAQSGGPWLDLVLLIDSSGSTTDTDPDNLRIASARYLLDYVQAVGEVQGATPRFAAANFNTTTLDEIPWTPLQGDAGREQLVARSSGNTDFGPALEYALQLRQQPGGAEKMAVVMFTDGAPCPAGPPCPQSAALNAYFDGLEPTLAALQASGAQVFVIALGDNSTASQWSALVGAAHYRFVDAGTDLAGIYHDFLAELLGLNVETVRALRDGDVTEIMAEPYLEQLVLSIVRNSPLTQVTVTDPFGGTPLPTRGGGADLHIVYAIPSPAVGRWQVHVTAGSAQVWVDRQYAALLLEAPTTPQALGTPVLVTGQLLRRGIAVMGDPDLHLSVTATGPLGALPPLELLSKSGGRYQGTLTDLTAEGVYTLTLNGEWGGQTVGARQMENVTVSLFPVPMLGLPEIQGTMEGGRPLTVTVAMTNAERLGPETEAFVRLLRADGSTVETFILRDEGQAPDTVAGDGVFSALVTLPAIEGRYRMECVLQGTSRDGVALEAVTPQQLLSVRNPVPTPTLTPTPMPTPSSGFDVPDLGRRYPWLIMGAVIGMIIVAGFLGYRISRYRGALQQADENFKSERAHVETEKARADEATARVEKAENTFLKRAGEQYQKGKEYLLSEQFEEAHLAFDAYFDILRQGFNELELELMPNLSEAASGLFKTLQYLPEAEREATLLKQAQLSITPELDTIRFREMAVALPDLWQPEQAIGKLYALLRQGGQCEPLLKAIAEVGTPPLGAFAQGLQQAMVTLEPSTLHRVLADARALPANSGAGLATLYEWLELLARYQRPPRLSMEEIKPVLSALKQVGPQEGEEALKGLVEVTARQLTAAPDRKSDETDVDYWQRVEVYLQEGEAAIRGAVSGQLPEAQILCKLAERWLIYARAEIEKLVAPPEIYMDLAPALSQVKREEQLVSGYWQIAVPVNLFNAGQRPAWGVEVKVSINYGRVTFAPLSMQQLSNPDRESAVSGGGAEGQRLYCVQHLGALPPGEAEHLIFPLEAADGADCRLQIEATYYDEVADGEQHQFKQVSKSCEAQYLVIAPPTSSAPSVPSSNPYTTGPLLNDSDWNRMAKGGAPETVREIIAKLEELQTAGRFVHIVGLRRSGKTTILKRVLRAARELQAPSGEPKFLCVYLDLEEWLERIEPYRSPETSVLDSALWHEILDKICRLYEHDLPATLRDQILQALRSDPSSLPVLPIKDFKDFLRKIQRVTRRTLCLALDEGEVLADLMPNLDYQGTARDLPKPNPITRIMSELQGIVEDERAVVLMARGYNEVIWERDGADGPYRYTNGCFDTWHTHLLSRPETLQLLQLGGFQATELGEETFWRLTGGYPLLIQVLGDHLYKQRALGQLSGPVSNGVIKRALFDLMTTSTGAEMLDFMRYGFKREEEMVLKVLAVEFTDYQSGYLQRIRFITNTYEGMPFVFEELKMRWPKTWESLEIGFLLQIMDRLREKKLLEVVGPGYMRWQIGMLCLLMEEIFAKEGVFAGPAHIGEVANV